MTDKFTIGSQWVTRGGHMAVVIGINDDFETETHSFWASRKHDGGFDIIRYTSIGNVYLTCVDKNKYDLIEPWQEPRTGTVWVNIYSEYAFSVFGEEKLAVNDDMTGCLARVKVPWKEGEGL